ncbi:hypothetical protein ACPCHT_17875 [Nucisporomicrobium flavum]|uniref:hypothetical protein n=1 Tax=Nucisporomicrobium flavum TaxID=2785915 RepID=UPI003C301385
MIGEGLRWAALGVAVVGLVAGCSSGDDDAGGGKVATLASADGPKPSASVGVDDQRPVIRLDATEAEQEQLWHTWEACLVKEGGSEFRGQKGVYLEKLHGEDPTYKPVFAKCAAKEPEDYVSRLERTDPAASKDAWHRLYLCVKGKGYKVNSPEPDTGAFGLSEIGPQGDWGSRGIKDCEKQVYAQGK